MTNILALVCVIEVVTLPANQNAKFGTPKDYQNQEKACLVKMSQPRLVFYGYQEGSSEGNTPSNKKKPTKKNVLARTSNISKYAMSGYK